MSKSTTMANMTTLSRELPLNRGSPATQPRVVSIGENYETSLLNNQSDKGLDNEESRAETSLQKPSQEAQDAKLPNNVTSPRLKDSKVDLDSQSIDISEKVERDEARHGETKELPQSECGASSKISPPTSSQIDHHAKSRAVGVPASLDHSHGQDLYVQSLPSCTTESEPRRIRAFAKLEFDDGQFYMNTYSVELGRDRRAAGRAKMDAGLLSTKGSSLGEIPPFLNHVRNISSSSVGHAQLSESGGIVAHEDLERKHVARRKKSKKSISTSSSSRRVSRKNSFIYPEVQTEYPPLTARSPGDTASKAPPDISTLLPPPSECPFVPIQPPNGARHQVISRQHLKINYNPEKLGFDMLVIGRNGAFHDGEWRAPGEEQSLHDGSLIQIGGTQIKFILPEIERDVVRGSNEDSVSEKMSFQFENGQGERITVSSGESSEIEAIDNINLNDISSGSDIDNSSDENGEDENESGDNEDDEGEDQEEEGDEEDDEIDEEREDEEPAYPKSQWQKSQEDKIMYMADLVEERVHTRAMRRQSKSGKPSTTKSRSEAKAPRKLRLTMPSKDPRIRVRISKDTKSNAIFEKTGKSSKERKDYDINKKLEVKHGKEQAGKTSVSYTEQSPSGIDSGNQPPVIESDTSTTNNTHEHPYLDLPPGIVIPPRRKGPGRPPKDGFMSKREKALLIRQAKEAEKSRKMGFEPGQVSTSIPKLSVEKRKYTKRRPEDGSTQNDVRADQETGSDVDLQKDVPQDEFKSSKPSQTVRSPSPEMKEADYTDEQLQRPNANYVILIHEAIKDSKSGEMNLQQIYHAIERRYPFYRFKVSTTGWQSSVRHNLQQNEAFIKVRREGKGYVWGVNPNITVEKEKKKRVTPPPQHRSYYHGYPATRPYGLQQSAYASQQGLHVSQSQPPYSSAQILLPTHLPGASRTSTYSSPYAPLSRPQPQPSGIQQLHHMNSGRSPFNSSPYGQAGSSSLLAQKNTSGTLPSNLASSTSNAQHISRQLGKESDALTSHAAAASKKVSLLSSRISSGNSTSQSQAMSSSHPKSSPLKHLPPNGLATVMTDFRQRFLGANEQSARSESIIDPIIRRFTHPKEPHDPPKPHENIIIRIIEGMLKEMQLNKTEGDAQKNLISDEKAADTEFGNPSTRQTSPQNHADRTGTSDQDQSSERKDDPGNKTLGTQVEKKEISEEVPSTVANGLLDSLASAAAASSANIVKSTPSHVVTASTDIERNGSSAPPGDTSRTDGPNASKVEPVALEQPESLSENAAAGSEHHKADITKVPKRSIDEVNGRAGMAGSDPDEKEGESKRVRP